MQAESDPALFALDDVRVVECADERGEFCGFLLGSLGAEVIKVEPPGGSPTRAIGPFFGDVPDPEGSIHFWNYNAGKKSVVLDLDFEAERERFLDLVAGADVFLDTHDPGALDAIGLGYERLRERNPRLIVVAITPFGQSGPWRDYLGCDLVYMALGGQMMTSGYPPVREGVWDTPPIAAQMWQSSHIAGNLAAMDVLAALYYRDQAGVGQFIDVSLHNATASCTENHLSFYMAAHRLVPRQHNFPEMFTQDGRLMLTMLGLFPGEWEKVVELFDDAGLAGDLKDEKYKDPTYRRLPEVRAHIDEHLQAFLATREAEALFHEAQAKGAIWAPIRTPHENLTDPHFIARGSFVEIEHPELGRSFTYPGPPWMSEQLRWRTGPRAPRIGEHTGEILRSTAVGTAAGGGGQ